METEIGINIAIEGGSGDVDASEVGVSLNGSASDSETMRANSETIRANSRVARGGTRCD